MKKLIATVTLMGIILMSSAVANTGHSTSEYQSSQTRRSCNEKGVKTNTDWGIFVTALTGIFVTALTGTIYTGGFAIDEDRTKKSVNCNN